MRCDLPKQGLRQSHAYGYERNHAQSKQQAGGARRVFQLVPVQQVVERGTPIFRWMGLAGPIDPYRGFAETNAYTLAFFDRYLKAQPSRLLDDAAQTRSETRLEVRRSPRND